ncbi:MAG: right-handed parallel beta-helix repeat-containing protein [Bryobacterales bacterium]|nr:right-handed parallel beta-helix repeat-containing protein [Bryobacterales bacterium]
MGARFLLFLLPTLTLFGATTLWVAPDGRSDAPGSQAQPLPSLAAARDKVRQLRASATTGAVTVMVKGGVYRLNETLVLQPQDSDVSYVGAPGERPILSGGRVITGWKKAAGNLWTASTNRYFRQMFVNGRRAQRARTPTNGFYRIVGQSSQDKPFQLKFRGDDIKAEWAGNPNVEVVALLSWAELRMPVASVDPTAHIARLTVNPQPSNREADARYFIENAPGSLDAAGEWLLDPAAGTVSYWPVTGEDMTRAEVVAPGLVQLVRFDGKPEAGQLVRNVVFRNLDFRHADWAMPKEGYSETQAAMLAPTAIEAVGTDGVVFDRCVVTQSGGYGIWFGRGSKRNRVTASQIYDMGAGGVKIGETAIRDAEADHSSDNVVADNDLHGLGRVYPSAIGVWVGQSYRNRIVHNHIHDLYYTAISVGWTWGYGKTLCRENIIDFNHLHHIGQNMLSDMGAIYTLGIQPGSTIRNNLIHDVYSFTYGGWGIYPDEGSTTFLIENNIVYRTKSAGFHQHYGRENTVRNNIFAFGDEFQLMRSREEPHISFTFEGNIVYYDSGALLGSKWTGDKFKMDRNFYWDARGGPVLFDGKTLDEWRTAGKEAKGMIADPQFANASNYDFRVLPTSPAWKMGWKAIDMSKVGPRTSPGITPR